MNQEQRIERLTQMLAPAGAGIHVVSTGREELRALQASLYGVEGSQEVRTIWRRRFEAIKEAKVVVLGVPSDTGAGFTRGANRAPGAIRARAILDPGHAYQDPAVLDLGDVRVIPHLLSEEMLSPAQRSACQAALYGESPLRDSLPVTPLDICREALDHIRALHPSVRPVVLGGDHSVGWPAFASAFQHAEREGNQRVGLLHFDAHTDLLEERLGVRYCFATWAFHANELLGRDGRLVQLGIRASAQDRAHWEETLGVRQYWPNEVGARPASEISREIIAHFRGLQVSAIYVSNDIDGTDEAFAAATGTPEPGGLHPDFVREVTQTVTAAFPYVGGDLVEVAPPLAGSCEGEPERTMETAHQYFDDLIRAGLREEPGL